MEKGNSHVISCLYIAKAETGTFSSVLGTSPSHTHRKQVNLWIYFKCVWAQKWRLVIESLPPAYFRWPYVKQMPSYPYTSITSASATIQVV